MQKRVNNKLDLTQIKNFCSSKNTLKEMEKQATAQEEIFAQNISGKTITANNNNSKISKVRNLDKNIQFFLMAKISEHSLVKGCLLSHLKTGQQHQPLTKCKLKPQKDTTKYLLEQLMLSLPSSSN